MHLGGDRAGLLAFLVPLLVRTIPEVLSWPYPLGFDTFIYAGYALAETFLRVPVLQLFKKASLLFLIYTLLYETVGDPLLKKRIAHRLVEQSVYEE